MTARSTMARVHPTILPIGRVLESGSGSRWIRSEARSGLGRGSIADMRKGRDCGRRMILKRTELQLGGIGDRNVHPAGAGIEVGPVVADAEDHERVVRAKLAQS